MLTELPAQVDILFLGPAPCGLGNIRVLLGSPGSWLLFTQKPLEYCQDSVMGSFSLPQFSFPCYDITSDHEQLTQGCNCIFSFREVGEEFSGDPSGRFCRLPTNKVKVAISPE